VGKRILIDTDILIDYVKGRLTLPYDIYYISEITLYEFIRGTTKPEKAKSLLEKEFIIIFNDNEIIRKAAEIWRKLKKEGKPVDDRDLIIRATAITKGLTLYTKNTKHFERLKPYGIKIVNHIS